MRCECGRYSIGSVCGYCLTGDGEPSGVKRGLVDIARLRGGEQKPNLPKVCGPDGCKRIVVPRVERKGLFCPCGEEIPMVAEIGQWVERVESVFASRPPAVRTSEERLLWYRCVACGGVTRETLVPAAI